MKWGLIGYGSIGKRHADNIIAMKDEVIVVSKNQNCILAKAQSVEELVKNHKPDLILISNETSLHHGAYSEIRKFSKELPILIEKPIFDKQYAMNPDVHSFVAYCLRFHPLVKEIKQRIKNHKILAASFYVGQYLPSWRAGRDYQTTYSAKKELGGGVLRDLSHEIDLAHYLLGDLNLEFCKSAKVSNLEITSDDFFTGFFSSKKCPNIIVEMNYLDRIIQRYFTIHTNEFTIKVDFIRSEITTNQKIESFNFDKNEMYLSMLENMRSKNYQDFSSFDDGLKILDLIAQAEKM